MMVRSGWPNWVLGAGTSSFNCARYGTASTELSQTLRRHVRHRSGQQCTQHEPANHPSQSHWYSPSCGVARRIATIEKYRMLEISSFQGILDSDIISSSEPPLVDRSTNKTKFEVPWLPRLYRITQDIQVSSSPTANDVQKWNMAVRAKSAHPPHVCSPYNRPQLGHALSSLAISCILIRVCATSSFAAATLTGLLVSVNTSWPIDRDSIERSVVDKDTLIASLNVCCTALRALISSSRQFI